MTDIRRKAAVQHAWKFVLTRYLAHVPEVAAFKAIQKPNLVSHLCP
ncbi:hypothetical protein [Mesorhizobium sp. M8A.F.Ca.ET.218.01.1.1]|nr:hypothetical protein [Mesorhizobium sp. M8A.F.Ca.ET.218.01.1.1]